LFHNDRKHGLLWGFLHPAFMQTVTTDPLSFLRCATIVLLAKLGEVMQLHGTFWIALGVAAIAWGWQYYNLSRGGLPHSPALRLDVVVGFILLVGMIAGL